MTSTRLYAPTADTQKSLVKYLCSTRTAFSATLSLRERLLKQDLVYLRETDKTAEHTTAKAQNDGGNAAAIKNITMPIVQPQVDAAVTYQTSVFLTGHPLFGVVAPPEQVDAGIAMETLIDKQARRGKWVKELKKLFDDGFKYNLGLLEVTWTKTKIPALVTTASGTLASSVDWAGNTLKKLDLYNSHWDTRVSIVDLAEKGEFVAYTERVSAVELKSFILSEPAGLIAANESKAFKATCAGEYYVPNLRTEDSLPPSFSWDTWAGMDTTSSTKPSEYKDTYEKATVYARIIPKHHNMQVPARGTPQIWKLTYINDKVLLCAELINSAHNMLPVLGMQPNEDGLSYQTKSLLDNVEPMQTVSSALMTSIIASRRKSIYDRGIYDPTMIDSKYINSDDPVQNIPLKPNALGQDVNKAYKAIPFEDSQVGTIFSLMSSIDGMADRASGQNKAQQGQFVKGNKTREEYSDIMGNANGRSQVVSILLEDQLFSPLKAMLKLNILQFQGAESVYSEELKTNVDINPVDLRNATIEFKLSDGLIPASKLMNQSVFTSALQMLGADPRLSAPYNMGAMVSYLFKTQGANIAAFEKSQEQQQFEQASQQWQQVAMAYAEQGKEFTAPQPTPEQFGWITGKAPKAKPPETKTILEQVLGESNEQAQK